MIRTSVIIPVYNVDKYLDKCIKSVLEQSQREIEIILVDDGSTDGSKKIIQYYESNYSCVKAVYQENHKLGAARNAGVLSARGKYIYFLDSDDYIDPFSMEKCYAEAEKEQLDFLMFDSEVFVEGPIYKKEALREKYDRSSLLIENRVFTGKEFWRKYYGSGGVYTNAYLFYINRQFFMDNNLMFIPEIFYEDNDWVIRLYKAADRVMYFPEQLYYRRIHDGSIMTVKYTETHLKSMITVCKLHLAMLSDAVGLDEIKMIIPRYIGMICRFNEILLQFLTEGKAEAAKKELAGLYKVLSDKCEEIWAYDENAGSLTLTGMELIRKGLAGFGNIGQDVNIYEKKIFKRSIENIPLDKNINLGIYGTGRKCLEFLTVYRNLFGEPSANIAFIDSGRKSGFRFWGYRGYNVRDIDVLQLDALLIASSLYGDEMEQTARERLTKDISIMRLPVQGLTERIYRKMIKVTIVIPVYNQEKYIKQCLDSVLSQTIKEKEVICVDDGSTDKTGDILEEYKGKYDNFIVVRQENKGAGEARNAGSGMARGEYIHFMDSDDYYAADDVLEYMYNTAVQNRAEICGGSMEFDRDGKRHLLPDYRINVTFKNNQLIEYRDFQESYYHPRYIFRTDMLRENNIVYPDYRLYEDPPFLVKAMLAAGSFYALKESVYVYRLREKERRYSIEDMAVWLRGIKDVIELAHENGLEKLEQFCCDEISVYHTPYMYWAISRHDLRITGLLQEMGRIRNRAVVDEYELERKVEPCAVAREKLLNQCRNSEQVIIYGAGIIGRRLGTFLQLQEVDNISGYAVSEEGNKSRIGRFEVKPIKEYAGLNSRALVIVAIKSDEIQKEVISILKGLNFTDIYVYEEELFHMPLGFITKDDVCYISGKKIDAETALQEPGRGSLISERKILKAIEDFEVICFNVFDSLLVSPFLQKQDMFLLMDKMFEERYRGNISFGRIRSDGEKALGEKIKTGNNKEKPIKLDDIYLYIQKVYGLSDEICAQMKGKETELFLKYYSVRETGKLLYKTAVEKKKKIIMYADTVYEESVIESLLEKNGYDLYEEILVLPDDMTSGTEINKVLYIGNDNTELTSFQMPKPYDVFLNLDGKYRETGCENIVKRVCGSLIRYGEIKNSPGYKCMISLAANKYFDNPFRDFDIYSDFNRDPYFIGYYLVGMHLAGIVQWISRIVEHNYEKVWFTSRDGWLVMKAYNAFRSVHNKMPESGYLYISRKAVMPLIVSEKQDFYDLPVNINSYTPEKVIKLLDFCMDVEKKENLKRELAQAGVNYKDEFTGIYQYHEVIKLFLDSCYDEKKHIKAKENAVKYLSRIGGKDIIFDLGYSGRIHKAICDAVNKNPDALFIHSDDTQHYKMQRAGNFKIYEFYDFTPTVSAAFREFLFSQCSASCTGYDSQGTPVFEDGEISADQKRLTREIHRGAMEFIRELYDKFSDDWELFSFKGQEVSMPFEGFLRYVGGRDRELLDVVRFEDEVWNARKDFNLKVLVEGDIRNLP